jgi:hypothetical protein
MKIIKNGIIKSPENKQEDYWWLNHEFRCKCECIFKLERSDFPKLVQTSKNDVAINLNCPYCNIRIRLSKPIPEGPKNTTYHEGNNPALFDSIFGDGGVFHKIFGEKPFKK